jgi:excisionase family DNA binding protein
MPSGRNQEHEHVQGVFMTGLLDSIQAAAFLGIHPKTLQRLAKQKQVPALRIGRLWRFQKSVLERWVRSKVEEGSD